VFHILNLDGEVEGWFATYMDIYGRLTRASGGRDILPQPDGTFIVSQSLGRAVLKLDPNDGFKTIWKAGQFPGKVGNFIGMGGICYTPDGNLMITDPTLSTMGVYDINTGKYLYSFGDDTGLAMASDKSRPALDFNKPAKPMFIKGGRSFLVYPGLEKFYMERVIIGDLEAAKAKAAAFLAE
jgi:hypothetical protein